MPQGDTKKKPEDKKDRRVCFVIMPISDGEGYEPGHFLRVYEHLIKPSALNAGFEVIRADEVRSTNYIVLDILRKLVTLDVVVCDLSARNPNVLYELGIRQAFSLPVVLIKDRKTDRVFDIQGFRTMDYDERLRIDTVRRDISQLSQALQETIAQQPSDVNSLVSLLRTEPAKLQQGKTVSDETSLVLSALGDLSQRIARLEQPRRSSPSTPKIGLRKQTISYALPNGEPVDVGEMVLTESGGDELGTFVDTTPDGVVLKAANGTHFLVPPDDPKYRTLSIIPF